jgi:dihydroorotate dehydrogenase (fumarate)
VHQAQDSLKLLMAGANVTMLASALLLNGPDRLRTILQDLSAWLDEHEYRSVVQLRGSMSQLRVAEPAAFERAHYLRTVGTFFSLADPLAVQSAPTSGPATNVHVPRD